MPASSTNDNTGPLYYVWGADRIGYGPVELPTLVDWIRDERVLVDTWVFVHQENLWTPAGDLTELKPVFGRRGRPVAAPGDASKRITAAALRRIKILAGMDEAALESLLRYMQPMEVAPFARVVRQGDPADAMFFIIEGELRAYVLVDHKESTLATLSVGETFGEIALLDKGQRSASVASNSASRLLRLPVESFERLVREAPALVTPFALGLAGLLAARLRALGKRFEDSIRFSRTATGGTPPQEGGEPSGGFAR
jgi:CRP-like cAMP-binding protein